MLYTNDSFHRCYSLILASEYDPYSIINKLVPYLGGSAPIVVQSPHVQVCLKSCLHLSTGSRCAPQILAELQNRMRALPQYLCPTVTEAWMRRYQVFILNLARISTNVDQILPGRTHPMMSTSGSGGYILHATKVYVPDT